MPENPDIVMAGLCQCGCGRATTIASQSSSRTGDVKGRPKRFYRGHHRRLYPPGKGAPKASPGIPLGYCHCGCGKKTPLATKTDAYCGYVKGQPKFYCRSHSSWRRQAKERRDRGLQRCSACKADLPFGQFYRVRGGRGFSSSCKACAKAQTKAKNLWLNYGLTPEGYAGMTKAQRGLCAVCGKPPSGKGKNASLHVDHDHTTGRVRSLLCSSCNTGLGCFKDDVPTLRRAIEYLTLHQGQGAKN